MECEKCGRSMRYGDIVHGIRYGSLERAGFVPARDSAVTVICGPCGEKAYEYVYSLLDTRALSYPTIFRMVTEMTSLMKNGYKLIQMIASLPAPSQRALQHLVTTCNESK